MDSLLSYLGLSWMTNPSEPSATQQVVNTSLFEYKSGGGGSGPTSTYGGDDSGDGTKT
jgi:hypothetical protein